MFLKALAEKPSAEYRQSFTWHIGNLSELETTAGYFAVGRITESTIPQFDPASGNFIDLKGDTSPYTFVVYDAHIGLIAIRKKSDLAPTTQDIASKIEKLLGATTAVLKNEITVIIQLIPNPETFLEMVDRAYAIKSFSATFTGPNPFDADEHFQRPLAVYLNAANGETGEASIYGSNLNKDTVTAVTKSTAATGNEATATIQDEQNERPYKIHLTGNPVKIIYDQDDEVPPSTVLADARSAYNRVRHDHS